MAIGGRTNLLAIVNQQFSHDNMVGNEGNECRLIVDDWSDREGYFPTPFAN
ncbi:MAG: hypothetical protein WCK11_04735 [Candidatus Falkowbacteria bacterium]